MYELYNKMVEAYNSNNVHNFEVYARMWVDSSKENPYPTEAVEHNLFFKAQRYCSIWRAGGIDNRSARRNMVGMVRQILDRKPPNPYESGDKETKKEKEIKHEEPQKLFEPASIPSKKKRDKKTDETKEDVKYVMAMMVDAYNRNSNSSYEMYVTHLMEIADTNPFLMGTDEYEMFSIMKSCFERNPPNKRRMFVVGKRLCDLINNTDVSNEKKTRTHILGVIPNDKRNWLKTFLPWRKEGGSNDSSGTH